MNCRVYKTIVLAIAFWAKWYEPVMAGSLELTYRWNNDHLYVEHSALPEEEFNEDTVERFFRSRLDTLGSRYKVAKIIVTLSNNLRANTKGVTEVEYFLWLHLYEAIGRNAPPVAELLLIESSAIMRMRNLDGHIVRKVLRGTNPLLMGVEGGQFELIHLTLYSGFEDRGQLYAYLVTEKPLVKHQIAEVTKKLIEALGEELHGVYVRNDSWFIRQGDFPVIYPFETRRRAPPIEEYRASPEVWCGSHKNDIACSGTNVGKLGQVGISP